MQQTEYLVVPLGKNTGINTDTGEPIDMKI